MRSPIASRRNVIVEGGSVAHSTPAQIETLTSGGSPWLAVVEVVVVVAAARRHVCSRSPMKIDQVQMVADSRSDASWGTDGGSC